jgi:hypothetical protein
VPLHAYPTLQILFYFQSLNFVESGNYLEFELWISIFSYVKQASFVSSGISTLNLDDLDTRDMSTQ